MSRRVSEGVSIDLTDDGDQIGRGTTVSKGVALIFDRGRRPGNSDLRQAVNAIARTTVSFDPAREAPPGAGTDAHAEFPDASHWLELLTDGLTFDLKGLAPGESRHLPRLEHRYNCAIDATGRETEAIVLEAGPHLAAAAHLMPVVRAQLRLANDLQQQLSGVRALSWIPARSAIAPRFFSRSVGAWLEGGPFPALGLLGFRHHRGVLHSDGLAYFLGAELELAPDLSRDRGAATRLAIRVVHELIGKDLPNERSTLVVEGGQTLLLEYDRGARIIGVKSM